MNEYVYVICYYPNAAPEDNPILCTLTFEDAEQAVYAFIKESEEWLQDTDYAYYDWRDRWSYFTDKGTYVINKMPLNLD